MKSFVYLTLFGFACLVQMSIQEGELTEKEKVALLNAHNELRAEQGSKNMNELIWDSRLEELALSWAKACDYVHPVETYVGQNLYYNTNGKDVTEATISWADEAKDWDFNAKSCGAVCTHYTQMVWANTQKVGCARILCPQLTTPWGPPVEDAYYTVCDYDPKGNRNLYQDGPYLKGSECTECYNQKGNCANGLCVQTCEGRSQCDCILSCQNNGVIRNDCVCQCPKGWAGKECTGKCQDSENTWCHYNPDFSCNYDWVVALCPKLCGACQA